MATYDNSYAMKITPNTPTLRGLTTNYSRDGQKDLGGVGLGDLFELDYDRNEIEKIFNQGTDAAYALKQKENQIAQNQYANNQFANQQSAVEALRQQRNSQIASGMARGLNAAQEQGTILGIQQEGAAGALELANERQVMADEIAAAYAQNVIDAMKESNAVKQAMANVSSALYEADMLGYTGELSAAAQMDANASTRYAADRDYEGALAQAAATRAAAKTAAGANGKSADYAGLIEKNTNADGSVNWATLKGDLKGNGYSEEDAEKAILDLKAEVSYIKKGTTALNANNAWLWEKALDGNNSALKQLGIKLYDEDGNEKMKGWNNDAKVKKAIENAIAQIASGKYIYTDEQSLANKLASGYFGDLGFGW